MKIVTNGFKNQIKTAGRMLKNTITCEIDNVETIINDDSLYSIKYSTYGSLLKSVMRMLEFEIDTDIPLNTVLTCQISMKVNNEWETLNFGEFIVSDTEIREESGHYFITCYDKMLYSMVDYESMNITYPITIRNYIGAICTKFGLTFKNVGETFANYDKEIPNELYLSNTGNSLGFTFRDVLDDLAQVTASTIWINEDGELELKYINDTAETFDGDSLKNTSVSFKDKFGPINSIVLSRSGESDNVFLQDEESIEQNGLTEIKIVDNQIMNGNNRSDYLQDILNVLDGIEYYVNDFQSTGILYLELYDKFNVTIGENTYPCIIFNDEIDLTNGLEEHIYSEIPNTSETDYKHASKTDRQINQVYIIAKKNEGEIEAVVSSVNSIDQRENNNYQQVINKFNDYTPVEDTVQIVNQVTRLQTDTYTKTEIDTKLIDGSVEKVKTTSGMFDENGLTIEKTDAKTKGNFNERGLSVLDATGSGNTELLFAGYDEDLNETIVRTKNIKVTKYLTIGSKSRIEDYEDGTGIFIL